jgi:menaquinone-dependent protoporphyrinogen oxidase
MKIISISLLLVLIGGFSVFASQAPAEGEKRVVIIYSSRYGSTARTAEWIAEGMGENAAVVSAKDAGDLSGYEKMILGSGIYGGQLHADMAAFLAKRGEEVRNKLIALFVVCGTPPDQAGGYLDMFAGECQAKPPLMRAFGGWQKKELLSPEDLTGLEKYYKSITVPFENYDHTDKTKCLEFGKEILEKMRAVK